MPKTMFPRKEGYDKRKYYSTKELALKEAKRLRSSGRYRAQVKPTFSPWRPKWTVFYKQVKRSS